MSQSDLIQQLQLRPKCYITIFGQPQGVVTPDIVKGLNGALASAQQKFTQNVSPIGAVQSLSIDSTRGSIYRRELNTSTAGKPVELIPGLPSYSLKLDRVVLYDSMLPSAFSYTTGDHDIIKQNSPLFLKLSLPGTPLSNTEGDIDAATANSWYVYGVWFKSNPLEFDVTAVDDLRIIQSVDAIAAGILAAQ